MTEKKIRLIAYPD